MTVRTIMLALVLLPFVGAIATGQVNEEWVARYCSAGGGHAERANDIAVDAEGNVYVTGSGGRSTGIMWDAFDIVTVKFGPDGIEEWAAVRQGPADGYGVAYAAALDDQGNVYVTGTERSDDGGGYDYITIKYDSGGSEVWVARDGEPGDNQEVATAIAVDAEGNVLVTGYANDDWEHTQCVTIKYDPEGAVVWSATAEGPPEDTLVEPPSLAVDDEGNVYVALCTDGGDAAADYLTIKYGPDGNEEWSARYDGPAGEDDSPAAIAVDGDGNVTVTGWSAGAGTSADYATIKYDAIGNEVWVARYDGRAGGIDHAHALTLDADGNAYVAGHVDGPGQYNDYDFGTIKYDGDGNELWVATYDSPVPGSREQARDIAVDADGNVYVTGGIEMWTGVSSDYATVKYAPDGTEEWVVRRNGPEGDWAEGYHASAALALDADGNAHVTGYLHVGNPDGYDIDLNVVKYNEHGDELWTACYRGPGADDESATDVAVAPDGTVYVTGVATVGYGPDGSKLWARVFPGVEGVAVATDAWGNACVTGRTSNEDCDFVTLKYASDGTETWSAVYSGGAGSEDEPRDIAVDAEGSVYVTGAATTGHADYATVKYSTDGLQLWVAIYDGPDGLGDWPVGIAVDGAGNVCVTGRVGRDPFADDWDIGTVMYDADGNELWDATYGGGWSWSVACDVAIDGAGNILVTGHAWGNDYDYLTVKYGPDGTELWVSTYNGVGYSRDMPRALAIDSDGNVTITGSSWSVDATGDYATVRYDPDGNELWVARYDGPEGRDDPSDIAVDVDGNTYVTGRSWGGDTDFDYATIKYDPGGTEQWVARYDGPADEYYGSQADSATAIGVDLQGNVYVTGGSTGEYTGLDMTTIKYSNDATPVEGSFYAVANDSGAVMLRWTIASLAGVDGFNLYRTTSIEGPFVRLNDELIPALAPGEYADGTVWPGTTFWYELRAILGDGSEDVVATRAMVTVGGSLNTRLHRPTPSPFIDQTSIVFDVPNHVGPVSLAVYNVPRGRHTARWDGTDAHGEHAAAGVYFVRLEAGEETATRKLVLTR